MLKHKIQKIVKNPKLILVHMCKYWPFRYISDKTFIKLHFRTYQGYDLNLDSPKTFNEKIQWLKLNDRDEKYTILTDKYLVRNFIKKELGEKYLIGLLGTWDNAKEIKFNNLPNEFVLKCNHDSGSVVICKNKEELNKNEIIKKFNKQLKKQYFWKSREYNYKNIKPKIIAEEYIKNEADGDLRDYKIFCFDGEPKFIQVDLDRFKNHKRNFYTTDWEYIPVEFGYPNCKEIIIDRPKELDEMLQIARKISIGISTVRIDLYLANKKIYFGEMTFHHGGGAEKIKPFKYDIEWGNLIKLNNVSNKGKEKK